MDHGSSSIIPVNWYSDDFLSVITGINIQTEVAGFGHYHRTLGNAIKITAKSKNRDTVVPNIHFIQLNISHRF